MSSWFPMAGRDLEIYYRCVKYIRAQVDCLGEAALYSTTEADEPCYIIRYRDGTLTHYKKTSSAKEVWRIAKERAEERKGEGFIYGGFIKYPQVYRHLTFALLKKHGLKWKTLEEEEFSSIDGRIIPIAPYEKERLQLETIAELPDPNIFYIIDEKEE